MIDFTLQPKGLILIIQTKGEDTTTGYYYLKNNDLTAKET